MEQDPRKYIPLLSVRTTEVHPSENHQKQIERYEAMPREAFVRRWKEEILPAEKRPQYVNGRGDPSQLPCDGTTVTFHTRDGAALRAVIYRPKGSEGQKLPVYFDLHGGGFLMGCPEMDDYELCRYRDEVGICAISLEYRLAPDYPYPIPMQDAYDGIKWFVDRAGEYGIDVARMAVGGGSAGGGLAFDMCMLAAEKQEFTFRMAALSYPVTDYYSHDFAADELLPDIEMIYLFRMGYAERKEDLETMWVSPSLATDEALSHMPPTVILSAGRDYVIRHPEALGYRIAMQGIPVHLRRFPNAEHGFTLRCSRHWKSEEGDAGISFIAGCLKMYLKDD